MVRWSTNVCTLLPLDLRRLSCSWLKVNSLEDHVQMQPHAKSASGPNLLPKQKIVVLSIPLQNEYKEHCHFNAARTANDACDSRSYEHLSPHDASRPIFIYLLWGMMAIWKIALWNLIMKVKFSSKIYALIWRYSCLNDAMEIPNSNLLVLNWAAEYSKTIRASVRLWAFNVIFWARITK
jgi:hypothetical protein